MSGSRTATRAEYRRMRKTHATRYSVWVAIGKPGGRFTPWNREQWRKYAEIKRGYPFTGHLDKVVFVHQNQTGYDKWLVKTFIGDTVY